MILPPPSFNEYTKIYIWISVQFTSTSTRSLENAAGTMYDRAILQLL
jgi:hypothetical protein